MSAPQSNNGPRPSNEPDKKIDDQALSGFGRVRAKPQKPGLVRSKSVPVDAGASSSAPLGGG